MNRKFAVALAVSGLTFAAQAAAQVTFYEGESFQGRAFTPQERVANFDRYGFYDRASSAVVAAGTRWEVCDDIRFRGRCTVLRPGRYPSFAALGLNDRVSSARAVNANARVDDSRYAPVPAARHVTFFEHEGFIGRSFTAEQPVENFTRFGFNDLASSVEVTGGRWEVCDNAGYSGNCAVLRPGRYPSLATMGLNDRVSSVRELESNARVDDSRYAPGQEGRREYRRRGEERLYEANVTAVRAVVGTPEQRCWIEKEQAAQGQTRDVRRCENVQSLTPTYWDVSYNFRGQDHRVQMTSPPGPTVTVNEQGEPRS